MTVKLHNTLTRNADEVGNAKDVSLYTCGLTVYSQPHIGNWVSYIYWDVLVRMLRASGYNVTRVQNITDVGHLTSDEDAGEDKMLKGALREGLTAWEVAEKYIAIADNEAYSQLGLIRPDHMPRATDYIEQQKAFVEELNKKGFTYVIDDGIYFDTSKLDDYGKLAKLDIEGLQFGARVADTGKKNPTDFAVWKFSANGEKRDMEWDSPIATDRKGFPGWHLECSVLARELLGDQIDIHTGGIDHIPVHHTNEIAQTEAVTGKQFSRIWLHANHIKVDGQKMSKSLENIYTLKDITDKGYDLDAFKLLVLSKHYATEGNFTWEILEAAQNRLNNWRRAGDMRWQGRGEGDKDNEMLSILQTNLDTPGAVARIDELLGEADNPHSVHKTLDTVRDLLGIELHRDDISDEQKNLISQRETARENKDWQKSDELREELLGQGVAVRDTQHGTFWEHI